MPELPFAGKRVWITGASSGIGEALAVAFAADGAKVLLSARREDRLRELSVRLPGSEVLPLDLNDLSSLPAKTEAALALLGGIDIMVHNGGLSHRTRAIDTGLEETERILRTNFLSTTVITRALLPAMRAQGGGRFVVVSSLMGKFGGPGRSSYAASKHALHGYYDALRAEEWFNGIRVTLVTPGYIKTEFSVHALTAGGKEHGKMDAGQENGMPAAECARRILCGVLKDREEIAPGGWETMGVLVKRFWPGLLNRLLRGKNID